MTFPAFARPHEAELTGRAATASVGAMIAVLFAISTLLTPLYVIYRQELGFSQITLTLIYATYALGNLGALLLVGRISDRIGRRRAALPALAIALASALVFLGVRNIAGLFVGRLLSGLAIAIGAGTITAWLTELTGDDGKAAMLATSANFLGLALGALASGLLAEYAPAPLELPFIIYIVALAAVAVPVWRTQETVACSTGTLGSELIVRPRISVPRAIRAQFVAPGVTTFGTMALVGFYAALAPSILAQDLHQTSHSVAGALFFGLAIGVAAIIVATRAVPSRTAMLWSLALMVPSVAALAAAQILRSMPMMIAATVLCAAATGLGYRGSLQVVNEIAPEDRRAEVVSSYFICGFTGNALPVIGIGLIATFATPETASVFFSGMIIVFALTALAFGIKYTR